MDSANPFTYVSTASSFPDGRGIDDNAAKCDQTSGGDSPFIASAVSFGTEGAKHAAASEDAEAAAAAAVLTPRRNAGAKRRKERGYRWEDNMTRGEAYFSVVHVQASASLLLRYARALWETVLPRVIDV